jgi:flavin-dependent dehydrogenase
MADRQTYDVVILGGGLAGLTLGIQLKRERPQTSVAVLDRREGVAPEAAFKVGESTVPSGAHYFAEVVGMKEHLEQFHIRKNGLRFFLSAGDNGDISRRIEVGSDTYPPHDNYQIDRGRFENELTVRADAADVDVLQGSIVQDVTFGPERHVVSFSQRGEDRVADARWVVDAAGRAAIIRNKLGLGRPVEHRINASWFRLAGGLDLEEWGAHDAAWLGRMQQVGTRQFSTNHLLGTGYWVWLIPLGSGFISIGVCTDPRIHPYGEVDSLDGVFEWLGRHEPQLAASVEGRRDDVEDFLTLENFAYGCTRLYSPDRWSLIGEAGAFADPFYSPGSDLIGYSNCFTADLIRRDLDGGDIGDAAEFYNSFALRTFEHVLSRTEDLYPVFGNPPVMLAKLGWDAVLNHYGTVLLFVQNRLADYEFLASVRDDVEKIYTLNIRMQQLFRDWHRQLQARPAGAPAGGPPGGGPPGGGPPGGPPAGGPPGGGPPGGGPPGGGQPGPPPALTEGLEAIVSSYDDDQLRAQLQHEVRTAEALAVVMFLQAAGMLGLPVDPSRPVNPYAVGLAPEAWEADGLYASGDDGLTGQAASALASGKAAAGQAGPRA